MLARWQIAVGDALTVLSALPEGSVQCCITSPPYWGLRDYGTGTWMGGDLTCRHKAGEIRTGQGLAALGERYRGGGHKQGAVADIQFRDVCGKCGALRSDTQMGLEPTPERYVESMVEVFREVRRVLRKDGTCWVNMGDSYYNGDKGGHERTTSGKQTTNRGTEKGLTVNRLWQKGLKPKDLVGMPWRLAFALQSDGWWLRQDIVWAKPNPMPESIRDRCTKSHEYLFLLSRSQRYFYDADAIKEECTQDEFRPSFRGGAYVNNSTFDNEQGGNSTDTGNVRRGKVQKPSGWYIGEGSHGSVHKEGRGSAQYHEAALITQRNKRDVWEVATQGYPGAHFATFPEKLIEPCILAGTSERGCCAQCGAPWRRESRTTYINPGNRSTNGPRSKEARKTPGNESAGFEVRLEKQTETLGWSPGCRCHPSAQDLSPGTPRSPETEPVPCLVLDPFAGAGTTGVVALRYGRSFLGIELNAKYARMAEERIVADSPLFNTVAKVTQTAAEEMDNGKYGGEHGTDVLGTGSDADSDADGLPGGTDCARGGAADGAGGTAPGAAWDEPVAAADVRLVECHE